MAVAPLTVQTPRVSLIGGKELPKASGEGIRTPDLTSPFAKLAADLQQKDEENRAITSRIEGQTYAEQERQAGVNAGLGPDGLYTQLKPIPRGDRYFQAAYFETRAQNAASDIRTGMSEHFNQLQTGDEDSAVKLEKMHSYASGFVESLDPSLQAEARQNAAAEIESRGKAMFNEDENRRYQVMLADNKRRIEDGFNKALSARSAGGNPDPHLQQAFKAIDEQVRLKVLTDDSARAQKEELTDAVEAVGQQAELTKHILDGDTPINEADRFQVQYRNGGNADLVVTKFADPNTAAKSKGRAAEEGEDLTQYGEVKVFNTLEMKNRFKDPKIAEEMAIRLNEVIEYKKAELKSTENAMEWAQALDAVKGRPDRLPSTLEPEQEKFAQKLKLSGTLDVEGPEGDNARNVMLNIIEQSKVVSPSFLAWMKDGMSGPDPNKSVMIAQMWNRLSTSRQGNTETGTVIRDNMSSQADVIALDELVARVNFYVRPGDPASIEKFAASQKEIMRTPDAVDQAITAFNQKATDNSVPTFNSQVQKLWEDTYRGYQVPQEFVSEMRVGYQINMSPTAGLTPEDALAKTFEQVTKGWKKSSALYGGYQRTYDVLDNPPGYTRNILAPWERKNWEEWKNPVVGGGDPRGRSMFQIELPNDAWMNDYGVNILGKLQDGGALVMDQVQLTNFNAIMSRPTDAFAQGAGRFTYKIARGNVKHSQATVIMTMNDGSEVTLMKKGANGKPVPVVLDIGLVNAHLHSRATAAEEQKALWETVKRERVSVLDEQYRKISGDLSYGQPLSGNTTADWTQDEIRKFLNAHPDAKAPYNATVTDSVEAFRKAKAQSDAQVPVLPEGADIAPEILNQSKVGGQNVTVAVVARVGQALGDNTTTNNFMLNIAAAESNYGTVDGTFRSTGDRGIFQINDGKYGAYREILRRSKIPGDAIQIAAEKLKRVGIDVTSAVPSDLDKPLINAAFARLYIMADPRPITDNVWEQGEIWKDHYNTNLGTGTVQGFVDKAGKVTMEGYGVDSTLTGSIGGDSMITPVSQPGAGTVVSMDGGADPANFRAMTANAQNMAKNLSAQVGYPIRITPHGGTQGDARGGGSQHHHGTAIDIYVADMSDEEKKRLIITAINMGYRGIGGYAAGDGKGTIHLDIRQRDGKGPEGLSLWWRHRPGVDDSYTTAPTWFASAIDEGAQLLRQRRGG